LHQICPGNELNLKFCNFCLNSSILKMPSIRKQCIQIHTRVLKEADDLIELALKKSQNGLKGFEPQVIAMQATTNTGLGSPS